MSSISRIQVVFPLALWGCLPALPTRNVAESDTGELVDCQITVPSEEKSIQSAINNAASGDSICIEPGIYYENLDFNGQNVRVIGLSTPNETIIDGNGSDTVVRFQNNETALSGLENITIQNGRAQSGAGIQIDGASPTLRGVIVRGNSCETTATEGCVGVGLHILESEAQIFDIQVSENTASALHASQNDGVGIHVNHSDIQIEGAWLNHNGFHVSGELDGDEILIEGVGFAAYNSQIDLSQTLIVQNWIMGNSVDTVSTTIWGVGFLAKDSSQINASHLLIADNTVEQSGISVCQGPLSILNSTIEVSHLRVLGNFTNCHQSIGSIAHLSANTEARFEQALFYGNHAPSGALSGGIFLYDATLDLLNISIAENSGPGSAISGAKPGTNIVNAECSNFYGKRYDIFTNIDDPRGSDGNFGQDPLLLNTGSESALHWDVHLSPESPLIDAGCGLNDDQSARTDPDNSTPNVGPYGGPNAHQWDLDRDSYPDWWQPRTYRQDDQEQGFDCNDLNAAVHANADCSDS